MKYNQNDNELLYLIVQKDEDAKTQLYAKYQKILANLANKAYLLCKNMNGVAYDDFYQEACYGFERAIITFDEYQNILFYTYMLACVKNQLSLYKRQILRKKDFPLNYAFSLNEEAEPGICYEDILRSHALTPYEVCEKNEQEEEVRKFQNSLPLIDACIFELRYNGFSYKEIASLLDIPVNQVTRVLCRIRKKCCLSFS